VDVDSIATGNIIYVLFGCSDIRATVRKVRTACVT